MSEEAFNLESWEVEDGEVLEGSSLAWSRKSDGGGGISADGREDGGLRVESDLIRDSEEA